MNAGTLESCPDFDNNQRIYQDALRILFSSTTIIENSASQFQDLVSYGTVAISSISFAKKLQGSIIGYLNLPQYVRSHFSVSTPISRDDDDDVSDLRDFNLHVTIDKLRDLTMKFYGHFIRSLNSCMAQNGL